MLTAPGHPFDFDGKDYFLSRIEQGHREEFHAYANAAAVKAVRAMAKFQSEEDAAADYQKTLNLVTTGHYWWDEEGGLAFRRTEVGFLRLFWMCLTVKNEKGRSVRPPFDDVVAMSKAEAGKQMVEWYTIANANPTPRQPEGSTAGESSTPNSPNAGESPNSAAAA